MDSFQNLMMGFSTALSPQNLLYAFMGSVVGTIIGVLPGIGPAAGIAMLIPLTYQLDPTGAIIMLGAILYGSQYGGTITSVLMNIPGEASTAVTCIEGYQMAKQGRAGVALSIAAIGSFIGGTVSTIGLVFAAPPLANMALKLGPPEFFMLMVLGLTLVTGLAGKSMIKALLMGVLGLLIAMIGMDPVQGMPRFTFGRIELMDGAGLVPVIMGLFGVGEVLLSAERVFLPTFYKITSLMPTLKDARDSACPIVRGTILGFLLGVIPGVGAAVTTFVSYIVEKKLSKHPEKFGTGVIEGVAAPETANNAHTGASLIPLFTLGIPASAGTAILMGAFMMHGLIPGPFLFKEHPEFVWAVIASMYIGNVFLVILNLPLVGLWVSILKIPYSFLFPLILAFTVIGAYSMNNAAFDVAVMTLSGVVGYILQKLDFPIAPIVLSLILGPLLERSFRQSLDMSQGDFSIFFTSPLSVVLFALVLFVLLLPLLHVSARAILNKIRVRR